MLDDTDGFGVPHESGGAISAWVRGLNTHEQGDLARRIEQRAGSLRRELRDRPMTVSSAVSGEGSAQAESAAPKARAADRPEAAAAVALFLEYAAHAGISPAELARLMDDPGRSSWEGMIELRASRRSGTATPPPAPERPGTSRREPSERGRAAASPSGERGRPTDEARPGSASGSLPSSPSGGSRSGGSRSGPTRAEHTSPAAPGAGRSTGAVRAAGSVAGSARSAGRGGGSGGASRGGSAPRSYGR